MTGTTVWLSDDCCPRCGGLLSQRVLADGSLIEECGCGWSVTWQAGPGEGEGR